MERLKKHKTLIYFLISLIILIILFFTALLVGRYTIDFKNFFDSLFNPNTVNNVDRTILLHERLPRTIMAGLVGIGLSLSGLVYQDIFQNKLVSPDFLGVSSGAGVGACIAILIGLGGIWICCFSFISGIIAMILTLLVSRLFKNSSPTILLLSGIIISGLMDSTLSFIKFMADTDNELGEITYWLLGTFSKVTMDNVYIMLAISVVCISILFIIRWRINIISLGKYQAETRGLNYNIYMGLLIIVVGILTSSSVAFCGIVGWVGLVIPHIVRLLVGRNTIKTIPLTILFGASFMIICDIISRTFTFSEIPLSAVTGFIGTPIFVAILLKRRNSIHD